MTECWDPLNNHDVSGFDVASISMNMMIVFNFAPTYAGKKFGRMVASDLTGWEGGLPDIYGIPPAELAALLNEWKRRSIPAARSSDG